MELLVKGNNIMNKRAHEDKVLCARLCRKSQYLVLEFSLANNPPKLFFDKNNQNVSSYV